jgi:RNA polymerase sigma-70 factor, ECF subfamily
MSTDCAVVALPIGRGGMGSEVGDDRSDEELLELVARNDDAALAELYDRYSRSAYGLALRVVRDRALAQDAVQEGFLAVWRNAVKFEAERARPSTWILTLVHRRAVDLVRREQRRRGEPLESAPMAAGEETSEEAALRERRRRVQAALGQLPELERQSLELAYYGGLTQSQLAEELRIPIGTVKSRMFSGLKRLRGLLGEDT